MGSRRPPEHRSRFTEDERRAAVMEAGDLMRDAEYSQNKAAEIVGEGLGVTGRTVKLWSVDLGLPLGDISQETQKARVVRARAAAEAFGTLRRLELSDRFFTAVEGLLDTKLDPSAMKDLATAFAILTDKRRLEEGRSTERHETIDPATALERGRARLSVLPRRA